MDVNALKMVALAARHGGFAAAARALNVDPSSVSRAVAGVEAALGLRLFHRTTRALSLTEAGALYLRRLAPLLEELDRAGEEAARLAAEPAGRLRLTASVAFAHECVAPHLPAFHARYPKIELELLATDARLDILAEGVDLAVRLGPRPSGDVACARLARTRHRVCASPAYLARCGPIAAPAELAERDCVRFALSDHRARWRFRRAGAPVFETPVRGWLVVSNALTLRQAARDGLGPALLADWLIGADLAEGRLIDLFPEHDCAAAEFDAGAWALHPSRTYTPRKTRAAIDFLRRRLRAARRSEEGARAAPPPAGSEIT